MYKFVNKDDKRDIHYVANIVRLSLFTGSETWGDKFVYIHIYCNSEKPIIIKKPYADNKLAEDIIANVQTQFEESLLNCKNDALTIIEC